MNLLVTGGAGFIGGSFVRLAFRTPGWGVKKLVNLDLLTYAGFQGSLADVEEDERYIFVEGDISDRQLVDQLLAEHEIDACSFVHAIQSRQGLMIACLEETGFHQGWLSKEDLAKRAASLGKSSYAAYLRQLAEVPLH
jgi:nucleoside-diphosphate-sugar epimerase